MKNPIYKQLEIKGQLTVRFDFHSNDGVDFMWRLYFMPNETWSLLKRFKWSHCKKWRKTVSDNLVEMVNAKLRMCIACSPKDKIGNFDYQNYLRVSLRNELSEILNVTSFYVFNVTEVKFEKNY